MLSSERALVTAVKAILSRVEHKGDRTTETRASKIWPGKARCGTCLTTFA